MAASDSQLIGRGRRGGGPARSGKVDPHVARRFSPEVVVAWEDGPFGELPAKVSTALLASGIEVHYTTGEHLHGKWHARSEGVSEEFCALVATGLVRIYSEHLQRQVTQRYVGPGFILGIPSIFLGHGGHEAQAVADCHVLRIRSELVRRYAASDTNVAMLLCRLLATCVYENGDLLSGNVFHPLRHRVARHLLDLADRDASGRITVHAGPQNIADATGTVREVVARIIKRMRQQGLVEREGEFYILSDPAAMHRVASGDDPGE